MPKRLRKPQSDPNEGAFFVLRQVGLTDSPPVPEKDPLAVELGRRGGKVGGKRRAENMTEDQRKESARKAAAARWGKKKVRADSA
jgi:hypothetical protein